MVEYEDFEEYEGDKDSCDNCGRKFEQGEIITVSHPPDSYTLCYTGSEGGCMIAFVFSTGKALIAQSKRFGGSKFRMPENPIPNYPNTPINKKKIEELNWLEKVLKDIPDF